MFVRFGNVTNSTLGLSQVGASLPVGGRLGLYAYSATAGIVRYASSSGASRAVPGNVAASDAFLAEACGYSVSFSATWPTALAGTVSSMVAANGRVPRVKVGYGTAACAVAG